ncbi:MAG: TIGR03960 family B12-binding radical SAM protein [Armatimonadota bacterium]|nr:TIGR03960 family B12-binding radical SAM protein [Armatimonadota bacterium]
MPIPSRLTERVRKLLAQESGTIYKKRDGRIAFALAFPNTYALGMSSLGFQLVYGMLNAIPDVVCERVFLPESDILRQMLRSRTPLFSLESQTPVSQFDVLGFSISFEMDYINVPRMLQLSGLPLYTSERDESHPLIIAGGPCATFNPEPLAEFIDAFLIGEAEDAIPEIVDALRLVGPISRLDLLRELTKVAGVYVPRFYLHKYGQSGLIEGLEITDGAPERVGRRVTRDLDAHDATSVVLTPNTEFADLALAEAIRGCGRKCRFCAAGYMGLPPRPRTVQTEGETRIGLVGSAVFDHPGAAAICEAITDAGREFSVSSIRIESLTDELAEMMRRGGQETITLAPEAGTEMMRTAINKPISDDDIADAVRIASSAGFRRARLYFMVGLPMETDEDVAAIGALASRIAAEFPPMTLQLSVSCFVPKPWTPFQWVPMASERELSAKLAVLRKSLAGNRGIRLNAESPRLSVVQGWLARGDRRLAPALLAAVAPSPYGGGLGRGAGYAKGIAEAGLNPDFYARRERDFNEILPWDHIDLGVTKDFLRREYAKALQGKPTPQCAVGTCRLCGVC